MLPVTCASVEENVSSFAASPCSSIVPTLGLPSSANTSFNLPPAARAYSASLSRNARSMPFSGILPCGVGSVSGSFLEMYTVTVTSSSALAAATLASDSVCTCWSVKSRRIADCTASALTRIATPTAAPSRTSASVRPFVFLVVSAMTLSRLRKNRVSGLSGGPIAYCQWRDRSEYVDASTAMVVTLRKYRTLRKSMTPRAKSVNWL